MNFQKRQELERILSNGYTPLKLNDESASEIYKMYKKDGNYFNRVKKAIEKICCNPEQAEKLTGRLKGYCSKHVGSKVIIYKHDHEGVYITKLDEHDLAYEI